MRVLLFEDDGWRRFLPLTALRSLHQVRCGILPLWEKNHLRLGGVDGLSTRPGLGGVWEGEGIEIPIDPEGEEDTLWLNVRVLWTPEMRERAAALDPGSRLTAEDDLVVAARLGAAPGRDDLMERLRNETEPVEEVGWGYLDAWYDLIETTPPEIVRDADLVGIAGWDEIHGQVAVMGDQAVHAAGGVTIGPNVTADTRNGPVLLDEGVEVLPGAFLQGPCYIGPFSVVRAGARLYEGCSIGPVCRVGGELQTVLMQGWSNKQHDGYLGNAAVGAWVNLGADTSNSDLKNTYGPVTVAVDGERVDTGQVHVGACLGDHTKTGIHSMLNTGTVVGVGCNLYGSEFHPVDIPDFIWGRPGDYKEHLFEKMHGTARVAMARRGVEMSAAYEALLKGWFEAGADRRKEFLSRRMHSRKST